ncbi:putative membrane protein SirB2 [Vogesella indigofera]|uniref:Putative membrane protein SirB2 n=1 Tax=Vogesella indigofera TaxID=45465 RepID=A0A495BJJ9_VOGIN|nr:SirB2 family protein [Vogesella indigofera]RKQ59936.1 putative membrane protein SirB2 [Vogesella indigofera]
MDYLVLKHAHAGLAYLSVTLFAVRAALSYARPALLQGKALRIAPHLIDTLLLAAGVTLAVLAGFSPHNQPWLAAKLVALLAYIALGSIGLKKLHGSPWRAVVLALALAMPLYMIAVAKTKLAWPF